jgi:GTP cyclohydrolase I
VLAVCLERIGDAAAVELVLQGAHACVKHRGLFHDRPSRWVAA